MAASSSWTHNAQVFRSEEGRKETRGQRRNGEGGERKSRIHSRASLRQGCAFTEFSKATDAILGTARQLQEYRENIRRTEYGPAKARIYKRCGRTGRLINSEIEGGCPPGVSCHSPAPDTWGVKMKEQVTGGDTGNVEPPCCCSESSGVQLVTGPNGAGGLVRTLLGSAGASSTCKPSPAAARSSSFRVPDRRTDWRWNEDEVVCSEPILNLNRTRTEPEFGFRKRLRTGPNPKFGSGFEDFQILADLFEHVRTCANL
ncbi:hypothetical protein C8F04DRAFT_1293708 [Mycena alexandri]|uniref:Uncharacterized protein n=1 Tax=Mycena alexandri TaxID=1745969 RepID=A0AAD6X0E8_9AGAR|nr:hypothetical protein C8F04DRAFT_1293708 [Mycena alexandri]